MAGGTFSYLDMETLYHVERLMSNIFPVSKAYAFGIAGLVIISGVILSSILAAFLIPTRKTKVKTAYMRAETYGFYKVR